MFINPAPLKMAERKDITPPDALAFLISPKPDFKLFLQKQPGEIIVEEDWIRLLSEVQDFVEKNGNVRPPPVVVQRVK